MDPASAAPVVGSAGTPGAPRTPASSPPSAGRSQTAAPPPAGSSPPHTPLAAPARTVPRLSSLRPLPILAEDLLLPEFCSDPAGLPGRSVRDFLSGALRTSRQGKTHLADRCNRGDRTLPEDAAERGIAMKNRGVGSVFLMKGSDVYHYKFYHHGKPVRGSCGVRSEPEARCVLKQKIADAGAGKLTTAATRRTTLDALLKLVLADYANNGFDTAARQEDAFNHL